MKLFAWPGKSFSRALTLCWDAATSVAEVAIALLTPDAPTGSSLGTTTLTAGGWGPVPRTCVMCTRAMTIPSALQQRFITGTNATFPANPIKDRNPFWRHRQVSCA